MQILVAKFESLTLLEQEASKEIIQESQELIGNSTLKILGLIYFCIGYWDTVFNFLKYSNLNLNPRTSLSYVKV